MRYYRYGEPEGRFIGKIGNYDLYPEVLFPTSNYVELQQENRSKGEFNFSYGPSAGGLLESVRFLISTPGEVINNLSAHTEYKQRELNITGRSIEDSKLIVERINGFHAASHTIAFLLSVEDALGIDSSNEVKINRIIEIELERIRSHLYVLSRMIEPAGFGVPLSFVNSLEENVTRLIGKYAGHRFFFGVNGLNSVDLNFRGIYKDLIPVKEGLSNIRESLVVSGIFIDRLQGNGKLKGSGAFKSGSITGPVARSSGFSFDARYDSMSLPYRSIGFNPIVDTGGDAYSRFTQRINEIFQSIEIIKMMENYLNFEENIEKNEAHLPNADGKGIARIESPGGDLTYLVEVENDKIRKLDILTPSKINFSSFLESMKGGVFTDFHFNWESFGIWISELAVSIR
ncbi:MAG: hypothetical protein QXU98_03420 [Candidatus Parvarchaeota archaeon]